MPAKIPEGFHTITPGLTVRDAAKAIDFYRRAFGAVELYRMSAPGGKIGHAELKIGDSIIMLSDEFPMGARSPQSVGGTTVTLHLYVQDVDAAFKQAIGAGAKEDMPPTDMFWGDRYGKLTDPFGHSWGLATHVKDVSPEEMQKGADEAFSRLQAQHG